MKLLFLTLLVFSNVAFAARLENVRILKVTPDAERFQLKLHAQEGPKDSYFFLTINKNDPEAFEKLSHVFKKLSEKEKYQLDLNIPSFSASPNGSLYQSEGIPFYGSDKRHPDSVKPAKK